MDKLGTTMITKILFTIWIIATAFLLLMFFFPDYVNETRRIESGSPSPSCIFSEMPPGYHLTSDGQGHFIPVAPFGTELLSMDDLPFDTIQQAKERAWELHDFVPKPKKKYNWERYEEDRRE